MGQSTLAALLWLAAGTIVPWLVSRLTGADSRAALIEAAIFAAFGLLIYPTMFALIIARFVSQPNINLLYLLGFVAAALTVYGYRVRIATAGRR
ncbi:MAG TPA: hypothetical protein VMU89_08585 [Thermomicrobiaceae bacterium]|nr:hypothetical protein [Thermomicrobiaceae bacterium]